MKAEALTQAKPETAQAPAPSAAPAPIVTPTPPWRIKSAGATVSRGDTQLFSTFIRDPHPADAAGATPRLEARYLAVRQQVLATPQAVARQRLDAQLAACRVELVDIERFLAGFASETTAAYAAVASGSAKESTLDELDERRAVALDRQQRLRGHVAALSQAVREKTVELERAIQAIIKEVADTAGAQLNARRSRRWAEVCKALARDFDEDILDQAEVLAITTYWTSTSERRLLAETAPPAAPKDNSPLAEIRPTVCDHFAPKRTLETIPPQAAVPNFSR